VGEEEDEEEVDLEGDGAIREEYEGGAEVGEELIDMWLESIFCFFAIASRKRRSAARISPSTVRVSGWR